MATVILVLSRNENYVSINGQQTRVIGRVAMDMIAIDVTHINAPIWYRS